MALIGRHFSISLVSTFGALNTFKTSNSRADLAVTFAGGRSFTARKWRFTEIKGGLNLLKAGHLTLRHQIKVLKGG